MEAIKRRLETERREDRLRCGSLVSSTFLAIALPLTIVGLVLPWWVGGAATRVIEEPNGVSADVSLWSFKVETRVDDVQAGTSVDGSYSSSWDDICAQGRVGGLTCHALRMIRFLLMGTAGLLFVALVAAMAAYGCLFGRPSLLWLLATAFTTLLACSGAGVVLFFTAGIGVDGLMGPGVACHVGALGAGLSACGVAVYVAAKASPHEEPPRPPEKKRKWPDPNLPRTERFRWTLQRDTAIKRKLEKAQLERFAGADTRSLGRKSLARMGTSASVNSQESTFSDEVHGGRQVSALKDVIFWDKVHGVDRPFPTELLEAAFNELDADGSGRIVGEELAECLRLCGLKASPQAVETILSEMDRNSSGDIDIFEFVEFFLLIQEVNRNQLRIESRGYVQTCVCRLCLVGHIFGLTMLMVLILRIPAGEDDAMAERNKAMMLQTWKMLFISFGVVFAYVIMLPIIRLTLGPSLKLWAKEVHAVLPSCPSWFCKCCQTGPQIEPEEPDAEAGAAQQSQQQDLQQPHENGAPLHQKLPSEPLALENEACDLRSVASPPAGAFRSRVSITMSESSSTLLPDMPSTLAADVPLSQAGRRSSNLSNRSRPNTRGSQPSQPGQVLDDIEVKDMMDPIHETEEERFASSQPVSRKTPGVPPLELPAGRSSMVNLRASVGSSNIPGGVYNSTTDSNMMGKGSDFTEQDDSTANGSSTDASPLRRVLTRLGLSRSRLRLEAQRPEGYDPAAFRQAAAAALKTPPPAAFSVLHMAEATVPASQIARTGCQPTRG